MELSSFPLRPWIVAAAAVLIVSSVPRGAGAQDVAAAARAFRQAQQADIAERFGRAAELYELADSIAPSPQALRSALRSHLRAGHVAAAATKAEQLMWRYPNDETSQTLAEQTLEEVRPRLARVLVGCNEPCSVMVDGASVSFEDATEHQFYVSSGEHRITARFNSGVADAESLTAEEGGQHSFSFDAPGSSSRVSSAGTGDAVSGESGGLPPWMLITSAALTVGLAGAATGFGLHTQSLHDDWEADQSNQSLYDEGRDFQLVTNVFIIAAGVGALSTLVLALLTDFGGDDSEDGEGEEQADEDPVAVNVGFGTLGFTLDLEAF